MPAVDHVKDLNASAPWEGQSFTQVKLRGMAKSSPNSRADVDSVCKNVYHSLLSLDVYALKTAPLQRQLIQTLANPSPCSVM